MTCRRRTREGRLATALGLLAAVALFASPRGEAGSLPRASDLVRYSFDDDAASGPDTFAVWQGARHTPGGRGHVRLTDAFHVSGHRSVELRDVAGDDDFPELQGYFPVRASGRLFFHFAFLITDPKQELNVALAGPRCFQLEQDGIAFWLGTREGRLVHYSDSIPKRLFVPEAFVWHAVDVAYDVAAGRYDLVIRVEGQEQPIVSIRAQPNAASRPGSRVDKFSFVGAPFSDRSSVVYYVDDVVIGTDESVTRLPFVAPGRRKLFLDSFAEYQRLLRERPRCLPAASPEDLGLDPGDLAALAAAGFSEPLVRLLAAPGAAAPRSGERGPEHWRGVLDAASLWSEGCAALERGDASLALDRFTAAAGEVPEARLFSLSAALALAALKRIEEADDRLARLREWREDPRYAVASAYVGLARPDLDRALDELRDPARDAVDEGARPGRDDPVLAQVAEQYYYVLLWKGAKDGAQDYALRMEERSGRALEPGAFWTVRAADACFYRGDTALARELYGRALGAETDRGLLREIYLKLADLAYLAGDHATEKRLREHYYGSLAE